MDRNRDGRRGNMAAMNGLSRRRPRSGSLRDSPEEDGGVVEMQESTRLRDRGGKKDRDRDRSSRSKRRRGDRMLHGSNREEGEDSTDDSMDEEEEEEDDDPGTAVRLPPPPPPPPIPSPQSSTLPPNHNHRKSLPAKVIRPPAVWKVADEMIGVSVPRKARTASAKRSHECWLSGSGGGGGGGGGGEQMHRQPSTSPSRPSQAATAPAPISPSSSNASVRKKTKQICATKHRPPKTSKSSSSIQEIEFEVAEVLYGLTRQFQPPSNQDAQMPDSKDANGSWTETKSSGSSPNSISPPPPLISQSLAMPPQNFSPLPAVAPKRKRPRPVKFEEERTASPPNHSVLPSVPAPSTSKAADGEQEPKMDTPSPKPEKTASNPAENGSASLGLCSHRVGETPADALEESKKTEIIAVSDVKPPVPELDGHDRGETKEEPSAPTKEPASVELDANDAAATPVKTAPAIAEGPREKFKIDLMAPPGKSSPERDSDFAMDANYPLPDVEMGTKIEPLKTDEERYDRTIKQETREAWREEKSDKGPLEGVDAEKPIKNEMSLDLQLEMEKRDKDGISAGKQPGLRQQSKVGRAESKPDKAEQSGSLPLPVPVAGWPGGLPFGYMGQVPSLQAVVPMDGSSVAPKALQAQHLLSQQLRPKRCATHCYIAQNILYHQQMARINPFWSAAAGSTPLYGAKPYNLNVMPAADSAILSNPLPAGFPGRGMGALQDKVAPVVGSFPGHSSKEKGSPASFMDQRKQLVLQQPLQAGSTSNMLPAPAFIFPLNQPQGAVAAAATSRTAHMKSTNMNVASSSIGSGSAVVGSGSSATSTPTVSFNYANLPQGEAQYLVLQNHGYPFPIPTPVGAPPYRGGNHAQAIPFFSGSLYTSQMLHPSQLQQQPQPQAQQPPPTQQAPQNASTSTSSSSSQKHPQHPQKAPGGHASGTDGLAHGPPLKQRQHLPPHQQARPLECETGGEDCPSTADSRIAQSQKGIYNHNFVMPLNPQNFALMSTAAALNSGVNHNDKLQQHPPPSQQQTMKIEHAPSQAFAMPFASFNGAAASGHHGFDFSATAQNHAIFQSLPEMARRQYQLSAPTTAAQAAQHKKAHHQHPEGAKFLGESVNASAPSADEKKAMLAGKSSSSVSQHSLSFSRPDSDPSTSAIVGNNVIDSSTRTLNLIQASVNGSQVPSRPGSAAPATVTAPSASGGALNTQHQQQQQHLLHLQKQHQQQQQQLQMQQQLASRTKPAGSSNNVGVYSDRLPAGTAMPKFPNALTGFPQTLIQGSNPTQSPQWKNSSRNPTSMSSPASNPTPPAKNHLPQQQGRTPQPTHSNVGLHSQISFGMNSMKPSLAGQQQQLAGASSIQTSVSAAATSVGSPPTSVSNKSAGGSPRASNGNKTAPPNTTLPLQQSTLSKNPAAGPSRKSSPVSNRNVSSILGQPHVVTSPSSVTKSQQQHQQLQLPLQQQNQQQQLQLQKQQQFPPAQIFFTNSYLPAQSPHSNAAAIAAPAYHQRRPSEQQQPPLPRPNSPSISSGTAGAANSVKGLPSPGLLQATQFGPAAAYQASGSPHTLMSAAGFSYTHAMSSVSVKPAEQKPAAGNDTLHACWQPEKR